MTSSRAWCASSTHRRHANPEWRGDNPDPATSYAPYRVFNIGNNCRVELLRYIEVLEQCLGTQGADGYAAHAGR